MPNSSPTAAAPQIESWPESGLEFLGRCPVCHSTKRKLLHGNLRDRVFFCAAGEWDMYQCAGCGSGYLDPRPSPATIGAAYSRYYTHGLADDAGRSSKSPWRQFRAAERNAYLNKTYAYKLKPASAQSPRFLSGDRRQRFDKYICFLPFPGKGACLLDVGCGNGRLMMQMQACGWEVWGVEPDSSSAEQAAKMGLRVVGELSDKALTGGSFDAITMNHVIEHLHDPIATLQRCSKLLKPGGMISINTPNLSSVGHEIFGADWFALDPPRHLTLFTAGSLRQVLKSCGFEPTESVCPSYTAGEIFRRSLHLQYGNDPMKETPDLPVAAKLKAVMLARAANRATRKNPEQGEEIVLLAKRA